MGVRMCLSVCLYVCVTRRYCDKTAKAIVNFFHHLVGPNHSFTTPNIVGKSQRGFDPGGENPPKWHFGTIIALYL